MDEGTAPGVCEGRWARALDWHCRCAGVGGTVLCGGGSRQQTTYPMGEEPRPGPRGAVERGGAEEEPPSGRSPVPQRPGRAAARMSLVTAVRRF